MLHFTPAPRRPWLYASASSDENLRRAMRRFGIKRYCRVNGHLACKVMPHERRWIERMAA